jgi:hypothetical protein
MFNFFHHLFHLFLLTNICHSLNINSILQKNRLNSFNGKFSLQFSPSVDTIETITNSGALLLSLLRKVNPTEAAGEFYFFFFGGSGALGIGFVQLPKLFDE